MVVGMRVVRHWLKRSVIFVERRVWNSLATSSGTPKKTPRLRMIVLLKLTRLGSHPGGNGSEDSVEVPMRRPRVFSPQEFLAPEPSSKTCKSDLKMGSCRALCRKAIGSSAKEDERR